VNGGASANKPAKCFSPLTRTRAFAMRPAKKSLFQKRVDPSSRGEVSATNIKVGEREREIKMEEEVELKWKLLQPTILDSSLSLSLSFFSLSRVWRDPSRSPFISLLRVLIKI